jgi:hypothetical protein
MRLSLLSLTFLLTANAAAYNNLFGFNPNIQVEKRSIDQIYQVALKEGGVVTSWLGGDEPNQQEGLKQAFDTAFPEMTLNLTVDLYKYHDVRLDKLLAENNVYIDTIALQTTHNFPRWKKQGALLNYAPRGFDQIFTEFRDVDAAYYSFLGVGWQTVTNTKKLKGKKPPVEFADFLKPEFKGKIPLAYPIDDDAVLWAFELM